MDNNKELFSNLLNYCGDQINEMEGSESFVDSMLIYAEVNQKLLNGVKPNMEDMQMALAYSTAVIEGLKYQQEEMMKIYMSLD